jgi:hypothetical protein
VGDCVPTKREPLPMKADALAQDLLYKTDAYWRAANHLAVGQFYLQDNPAAPAVDDGAQATGGQPPRHDARAAFHLRRSELHHHVR